MNNLKNLRKKMNELGIGAVLIYDELNQQYLSDFAFTDGFLLITLEKAYLVTDFRYYEMAVKNANPEFEILTPDDRTEFVIQSLGKESIKTVGFEGKKVSYSQYKAHQNKYPNVEFVDIEDTIEILRQIKTPEEIEKMQIAQNITDKAFSHILSVLNTNMTEQDVATELEYAMKKNGATSFAFETIAVSGDASALPHGTPRNVKLRPGFLTMDFGAKYQGYCSDMTRTVVIGKATEDLRKIYNTVLKAQEAALAFIREGVDCADADMVARQIIDLDYKGTFGHSLGHSVGLFIHELPSMSVRGKGRTLRTNEVVTVEPGIYIYGKYGCRIEDMVKVHENGIYNFTKSTKELIEII